MKKIIAIFVFCVGLGLVCSPQVLADNLKEDAEVIVNKARLVIEEVKNAPDSGAAYDLIRQSAGVAIIPDMFKGGFVVGGSYGKGVVMARKDGKWSGPSFVYIGAGSVGFQIGVQITDLILVVIGQNTMDSFMRSNFKLGVDAAMAAGPVGAQATAATDLFLKGGIYSYHAPRACLQVSLLRAQVWGVISISTGPITKQPPTPKISSMARSRRLNQRKNCSKLFPPL